MRVDDVVVVVSIVEVDAALDVPGGDVVDAENVSTVVVAPEGLVLPADVAGGGISEEIYEKKKKGRINTRNDNYPGTCFAY